MVYSGHMDAGFAAVGLADEAPFATAFEMLGSFCVTKLPQMRMNAMAKSGPTLSGTGPK